VTVERKKTVVPCLVQMSHDIIPWRHAVGESKPVGSPASLAAFGDICGKPTTIFHANAAKPRLQDVECEPPFLSSVLHDLVDRIRLGANDVGIVSSQQGGSLGA